MASKKYGAAHRAERERWQTTIDNGEAQCAEPICLQARCNRSEGAHYGNTSAPYFLDAICASLFWARLPDTETRSLGRGWVGAPLPGPGGVQWVPTLAASRIPSTAAPSQAPPTLFVAAP